MEHVLICFSKLTDEGRYAVTKREGDKGTFKTPTLRQVSQTAPYMHDGSMTTLSEVVDRYNQGGIANPYLDREIRPLKLTDGEKRDLVAFLDSLTGNIRFESDGGAKSVEGARTADRVRAEK